MKLSNPPFSIPILPKSIHSTLIVPPDQSFVNIPPSCFTVPSLLFQQKTILHTNKMRADAYAQHASTLRKPTVYLLIIPVGEFALTPQSDSWMAAQNLGTFCFYNLSSKHFVLVMQLSHHNPCVTHQTLCQTSVAWASTGNTHPAHSVGIGFLYKTLPVMTLKPLDSAVSLSLSRHNPLQHFKVVYVNQIGRTSEN